MNIMKLTGSIFMVFVLISAPFFAIQTRQEGINRVLADGFITKSSESTFEIIIASSSDDNTVRRIDSDGNQIWSFNDHTALVFGVTIDLDGNVYSASADNTLRKIDLNGNQIWSFTGHNDRVRSVAVDSFGNVYSASDDNTVRKLDSNGNQIWSFTGHNARVFGVAVFSEQIQTEIQITYYDIFENARLANYSDVDAFTNIFYQIPRMASTIAETYNRFINFTDNINPFRTFDESTGEFRDLTPSETMDSWPARIISWFRRFRD